MHAKYSLTGALEPGVGFRSREVRPADPQDPTTNQVRFDYAAGFELTALLKADDTWVVAPGSDVTTT